MCATISHHNFVLQMGKEIWYIYIKFIFIQPYKGQKKPNHLDTAAQVDLGYMQCA